MIAILLLLATAALLVFYINIPLLYCYPILKHDYLMRISESKCFSWHGLCLLLQGITRSPGGMDMQRVEVPIGQARLAPGTSSDRPAQLEGIEGCHTRSQGCQVLTLTFAKAW